ncbi:MAG: transporter ATPase [Hyphomicrobiales bacterium]|nr:transporter ATPase [Hyphomicrobiales bacterium]
MQAPAITLEGEARIGGALLFPLLRLELAAGQWTCLLGASGVGKTTLLRLIAGLDTGAAFTGAIGASDGAPLAGRIAYIGQADMLAPWLDVTGNVVLGQRLRGEAPDMAKARDLIARVGLSGQARQRPHTLSGGQRQRASLARTLMEDRPVVLLDEPFSALDARTRAEMQELAGDLLQGRTVLLVTHEPGEATRLSHRALLMTHAGLSDLPLPQAQPVRDFDAPETLQRQAEMFRRLRSAP